MLNPIINLCYNETLFIAYEVNSKKTGESNKWKIQYTYFDLDTQEIIGPFYVKSEESTEEQNPDAFWSNGVFWTFSTNNTNSWTVEFTSCARADLNSFSTLSADFMPILFNENAFSANMSVYFDLDLTFFTNDLLETEDRLRFIVTLELGGTQHVVLDTDWNSQSLDNWVENNLATYYPRYLRYFYNLSQSSLAFSEIYAIDSKVQNKVYPFELHFPYAINFSEHFNLRFNLVKDDWSLNKTADLDRYQLGIDNVYLSFELNPTNFSSDSFGVLTKSYESNAYAQSEFLVTSAINLEDITALTDPSLVQSDNNMVDLSIDFDAFSLFFDQFQHFATAPYSNLECEMMIMVQGDDNPDIVISDEFSYNSFTGYQLIDFNLEAKWSKDFGSLYYSLNLDDFSIEIFNKDDYFRLSSDEKRAIFSVIDSLDEQYDEIYVVLKFKIKTYDLNINNQNYQNGINLIFNDLKLPISWLNDSGYQQQDIKLSKEANPFLFLEKTSKEAYIDLLSDYRFEIDYKDDYVVFSSYSNAFYPSGSEENYRYYLPVNQKPIEQINPSEYLNTINLHLSDCVGYYDPFAGLLIDGQELESKAGVVTPNLYSNNTSNYYLRTIVNAYPVFNYQNGTDLDKSFNEFKSEFVKLKLEIFDQYSSKVFSKYSNTIIRMQDFDINDFTYVSNDMGERYYYMKEPLKVYIYGCDIITSTDYIYLEFITEFSDTFYVTTEKTFRNQWGLIVDSLKFEFIQGEIIPEFVNIDSFEVISGECEITVRAIGDDFEWSALYYDYKHMGNYSGYDLIENTTIFEMIGDYAYFTFTWNTSELVDDSIYELLVVIQNNKGLQGNLSITNVTVVNSYPNITCLAHSMDNGGNWNPIADNELVSNYIKLSTVKDGGIIPKHLKPKICLIGT
ncbi:hypothetical protein ES707_17463 [subsurface metagenome]